MHVSVHMYIKGHLSAVLPQSGGSYVHRDLGGMY